STENQNNTQAEKTHSSKTRKESHFDDDTDYHEVSVSAKDNPQSTSETITKEALIDDMGVLGTQLQELGVDQTKFEALMALLGLNGDADIETLQQSLSQALNLTQKGTGEVTSSDLIAKLQQNKGETVNLLKQAGLSDSEAKNLLNQLQALQKGPAQKVLNKDAELQTLQKAPAQKVLNKDAELQTKVDSQIRQSTEATTKISTIETNQDVNDEAPILLAQLKNTAKESEKAEPLAKGTQKTDLSASVDKLQ
ncbi:MAG: hypothetical protein ACKVK9_06935, partial [Nitrospinaceae bacterium]